LARLHDGDHALDILYRLLRDSTYPSLLGAHPPFQIDGSLGAPAAIIELLVQSHTDELHLLPALPTHWHGAGSAHGICARGGLTIDLVWRDGHLHTCHITAKRDCTIGLRGPNPMHHGGTQYDLRHGCTLALVANHTVQLQSSAS
jgi:alpha-L-fucosidase 2